LGHWFSNIVAGLILFSCLSLACKMRRRPYWSSFRRDLFRRKSASVSLAVVSLYLLVALCDSVAWRDTAQRDAGDLVAARAPRSVLDRACDFLGLTVREDSYSAPFARVTFSEKEPLNRPKGHPLGTDILGRDVLYLTLKGVRPAMMIGGFTSMIVIPVALFFGILAGYFGGWVDDVVQYLYTTLASIPGLLLLIALIMAMGRSTVSVCVALGVTSWVGFCRLLRGETLKVKELEFVESARALGTSHAMILFKHILPNVFHLVVITFILRFSGLVLSESILAYLGLGLDASWGSMIDLARDELARDPIIWWHLTSAATALFLLVLAVNFLGDAVRDVLDPRTRRLAR